MSQHSTHHLTLLNSIPQIHQSSPTEPIQSDSDDDDVVFLASVPKVPHTPENYDPNCQCSTCQIATKLLAECTCEECKGQQNNQVNQTEGKQVAKSSENVPIVNQVSPTNGQPSESPVQNNDVSTSEHTNANDLDDDRQSRSSTPDYQPQIIDVESGDSSSDDDDGDDGNQIIEIDQESESFTSNAHSQPSTSYSVASDDEVQGTTSVMRSNSNCQKCGRYFENGGHFTRHFRSHANSGFRCTFHKCGFFFSKYYLAKKHLLKDHLKGKLVNLNQFKKHLIKVDPNSPNPNRQFQDNDASTSEHLNDQDDDRESRSSTLDNRPPFLDDNESGDSSMDDNENSESSDDDDDKELDEESESDYDDSREPDYAYSKASTSKSRKRSHSNKKSNQPHKHIKLSIDSYEKRNHKCPKCRRIVPAHGLKNHIRAHAYPGIRCEWPKCGFFYSHLLTAKKHVCRDHLKIQVTNSMKINQYLVRVNPKNGKTRKVLARPNRKPNNQHFKSSTKVRGRPVTKRQAVNDEESSTSSSENESDDNSDSDNSEVASNANQFQCSICESNLTSAANLRRHYLAMHQQWKPYYCKWPKCDFVAGIFDNVVNHTNRKHFKSQDRQKARKYVGKRENPSENKDPILESLGRDNSFNSNCPKCGINFRNAGKFKTHLDAHKKSGLRCTWPMCGAFYSGYRKAKKHILREHYAGKLVNSTQVNQHLVMVDPKTGRTSRIKFNN